MPHVLMIDDDVVALDIFGRFFTADGFNVSLAANGRDGLSLAGARSVDLVVLDLYLPDMSGLAVLSQLREVRLGLPVLIVSGFGTLEEAAAAMKLGAVDVLSKPLDAERLVAIARSVFPRSTPPKRAAPLVPTPPPGVDDNAVDEQASTNAQRSDHRLVASAQSIIETHLADTELSLATVGQALGVSRWRLSRAFSRCGVDFRSSVRDARIQHAVRRLRTEPLARVKEVAIDVGYRHASDFSRHFRAHSGMTPTEFRRIRGGATTP